MKYWPSDLPLPNPRQIQAAVMEFCHHEGTWPQHGKRKKSVTIMRHLAIVVLQAVTNLHADELADAAGFRSHSSVFDRRGWRLVFDSPEGHKIRDKVIDRLIRKARGEAVPPVFMGRNEYERKMCRAKFLMSMADLKERVEMASRTSWATGPQVFSGKPDPFAGTRLISAQRANAKGGTA